VNWEIHGDEIQKLLGIVVGIDRNVLYKEQFKWLQFIWDSQEFD